MKRLCLVIPVFLFFTGILFSFDTEFGVKIGGGLPWFSGSAYESYLTTQTIGAQTVQTQIGLDALNFGMFFCFGILDFFALQPELYLSRTGGKYGNDYGYITESTLYLEFAVLAKGRLKFDMMTFSIYAGPDFLFRIGDSIIDSTSKWNPYILSPLLINATSGVSIEFEPSNAVTGWFAHVDLRFVYGLTQRFISAAYQDWKQNGVLILFGVGKRL
jgi:hypothetical protein